MNEGVKLRSEIEGKDNSSEDKSNYKRVYTGDMVYNSMRMWQGANGISAYDGIVSPAYTVLKPKNNIVNDYFAYLFKNTELINKFRKNSQGLTSDTWNLKYPQIATIKIVIPRIEEQQKIADFLSLIDKRIEKQRQLVESLKKYKRGVFSKLYSQISDKEKIQIKDLGEYFSAGLLSKDDIVIDGQFPCLLYGELFTKYDEVITETCSFTNKKILSISTGTEILFPSSTTVDALSLICPSSIKKKGVLLGGDLFGIRLKEKYDNNFMSYLFNHIYKKILAKYAQGITIVHLHYTDIKDLFLEVPPINEQQKITFIMNKIEIFIATNERILTQLLALKQGFLQQMFI